MLHYARSLRVLLLLSGLILTVHTLVPHVHGPQRASSSEVSIGSAQEKTSGWLAVLADLVDVDMGEDHLEYFSPEKALDLIGLVPNIIPARPGMLFSEPYLLQPETAVLKVEQERIPRLKARDVFLRQAPLRGPPARV